MLDIQNWNSIFIWISQISHVEKFVSKLDGCALLVICILYTKNYICDYEVPVKPNHSSLWEVNNKRGVKMAVVNLFKKLLFSGKLFVEFFQP